MTQKQVSAVLTPSRAPIVAGAMIWAYQQLLGYPPPAKTSWLYPLALSSLETAHWTAMWNHNPGNVAGAAGTCVPFGDEGWYDNPHVTTGIKFSSFSTLGKGCRAELQTLDCMHALQRADEGDYSGFMAAVSQGGYVGQGGTYPDLSGVIAGLEHVNPVPYDEGLLGNPVVSTLLVIAGIGLATGVLVNVIDPTVLPRWARI